jgi:Domain of unknown function (DUF5050)/LVIVD repeat
MFNQIGTCLCYSTPWVWGDFVYFQGYVPGQGNEGNGLYQVEISNPSNVVNLGPYQTGSTPRVSGDGNIYFMGYLDNGLWQASLSNPQDLQQLGTTLSSPCVPGDGYVYYQGSNNELCKVAIGMPSTASQIEGYLTSSTPCVPGDGYIYFQGTDNRLYQVQISNPSKYVIFASATPILSTPCVPGDGYIYFQGAENALSKLQISNPSSLVRLNSHTSSTPAVPGDGYIYFQRFPDNSLYQMSLSSGQSTNVSATKSAPCVPGDGYIYYQTVFTIPAYSNLLSRQQAWVNFPASDWMKSLAATNQSFGSRSLKQMVIPGTHDAGMYETRVFGGFSSGNAQTQNQCFFDQLSGGVRYFDLRVADDSGTLYVYHGKAWGPTLESVLADVNEFMAPGRSEIVILKFSHFYKFNDDLYESFLNILSGTLQNWLYTYSGTPRLSEITYDTFVEDGMGKVLVVSDYTFQDKNNKNIPGVYRYADGAVTCESGRGDPTGADMIVYDCYSDSEDYAQMLSDQDTKFNSYNGFCNGSYTSLPCDLYLLSWTLTPSWPTTVLDLAQVANGNLPGAISAFGKNQYGQIVNIIYVDYYELSGVTNICYGLNNGS